MKFTDSTIKGLKPKTERYEVWEDGKGGFGLRVAPSGRKSWIYLYRFQGKPRRMTLGAYPQMGLAAAHVSYTTAKEELENGIDPGRQIVNERQAERQAETVAKLIDLYLEKYARPNKRSAAEDERMLNKEIRPLWGRRKAKDIERRDVITLLDDIVDRGSPVTANRALAAIRKMFNWAISRDILGATPCVMVERPYKETPRDRVLSPTEIASFWHGLGEAKMVPQIRLALKFMLVTGQRRDEVMGASWSEFDHEEKLWTISGSRTKNGSANRVPLSPLALELLAEIRELSAESEWLFPHPRTGEPIKPAAASQAMRKNLGVFGFDRATPHDLRRTCASLLTENGVTRLVVSKLLNHSEKSVTGIYDRYEYTSEKRRALDAWADRLTDIVSGKPTPSNVVRLQAVK